MKLIFPLLAAALLALPGFAATFQIQDENGVVTVAMAHYQLDIIKKGFRYGFVRSDGRVIAPPHAISGLEFGRGQAANAELRSPGPRQLVFDVTNDKGEHATVTIEPAEHYVRFGVTPSRPGRIVARFGGILPAFGLGDHASVGRTTTDVSGYMDERFRAQEPPEHKRLISNFLIAPRQGVAVVNMEKGVKIVRVTADETAQGSVAAPQMPALYYFLGAPPEIYAAYLQARNREGYPVYRPKYEFFGVGWEAFGALGWKTNEKTVTENVERYLSFGYPLEWMVVGSGFWPNEDPRLCATTSFGLWDQTRYPDPKGFIEHFKSRNLKFFLGLRISFIEDGPYSAEGVAKGYFLGENGHAKAYKLGFPKRPAYLLNGANPEAVKWYVGLCQKWRDYGVDGFKEDLFTYQVANMPEGNIDAVNRALMDQGVFIMGRNGYLGSAADIHRMEDFNFDQNQDRGPINALAFAYSGFPYVYPDMTGGTFGEGRKMPPLNSPRMQRYIMRVAQFDSVNPSMAMGMGPWNFGSEQVEQVVLAAAQLHARLHPYIYSAAVDAFETGFPWTLAPLPLVFPDDPRVYGRENATVRGYEWMLGPSLLATPLYGDDYATAESRDVYLPAGKWLDYDTGRAYEGPVLLKGFLLPPGKTPLFVGGKGVLVLRDPKDSGLRATVYPIQAGGSTYRFTHPDATARTTIINDNTGWNMNTLAVSDTNDNQAVAFEPDNRTGAICFTIKPGHGYRLTGGAPKTSVKEKRNESNH
jgi:alpha-glucosidase (family GH31 glycosyl hydrolase)